MQKKEVPRLNKDNLPTQKSLTRLHLVGIGDIVINFVENTYVEITIVPLISQKLKEKQEHKQAMLETTLILSYAKSYHIKYCKTTKEMWDILQTTYGGNKDVLREKLESWRFMLEAMRMVEGENIVQYCGRINEVLNSIKGASENSDEDNTIKKVLRTLVAIYAIRVSTI